MDSEIDPGGTLVNLVSPKENRTLTVTKNWVAALGRSLDLMDGLLSIYKPAQRKSTRLSSRLAIAWPSKDYHQLQLLLKWMNHLQKQEKSP